MASLYSKGKKRRGRSSCVCKEEEEEEQGGDRGSQGPEVKEERGGGEAEMEMVGSLHNSFCEFGSQTPVYLHYF